MTEIPFIGQAYTLPSVNAATQRCFNLVPEAVPGDKSQLILKKRSGLKPFTTLGLANRALFVTSKERMFSVNGNILTEVFTNGGFTNLGNIATSSGPVQMADNGSELIIVDGNTGYRLNLDTNSFAVIADVGFPDSATHVTFQDSYRGQSNSTPSMECE